MSDAIFGPLIVPTQVGDAVQQTLITWLPTYLGFVSRQIGQPSGWLVPPNSYVVADSDDHWPEDAPPAVVIKVPGIRHTLRHGPLYEATWSVSVDAFVSANDRPSTERLAKHYAAALRLCLIQKATLGGFAIQTSWTGEAYDRHLPDQSQRSLGSCSVDFDVTVASVAQALTGPLTPAVTGPPDWPTVKRTQIIVTPER